MAVEIVPGVTLADSELEVTYILASGPGGQNVNKVATAAQLRFDAANSPPYPSVSADASLNWRVAVRHVTERSS